jgi:hypothetical protein
VEAEYGGGYETEPSVSKPARLSVRAQLVLRVSPKRTHWGSTIQIQGKVRGGYIPRFGEVVFLWVRWKDGSSYVGHVYTRPSGHFSTEYTFSAGRGTVGYRFWASTGRETDYPYAPNRSNRVPVTVSP